MYDPGDVCEHLFPIALSLAGDRVADVRFTAYRLVSLSDWLDSLLSDGKSL